MVKSTRFLLILCSLLALNALTFNTFLVHTRSVGLPGSFFVADVLAEGCEEGQIDINAATPEELEELDGVGPVIAGRIVEERPFESVDDLERVSGIGPVTLAGIQEQGLACVSAAEGEDGEDGGDGNATSTPTGGGGETATSTPPAGEDELEDDTATSTPPFDDENEDQTSTSTPPVPDVGDDAQSATTTSQTGADGAASSTPEGGEDEESYSPQFGDVLVNEIAWMGTEASANDEWIELRNTTTVDIVVDGWELRNADGSFTIMLPDITLLAAGFLLLERTDDESVPGISADVIYTGVLPNTGETLVLLNATSTEIDRVEASDGWPAGDNASKATMQRQGSTWVTAEPTPKNANTNPAILPPAEEKERNTQRETKEEEEDEEKEEEKKEAEEVSATIHTALPGSVIINEIAWMGTEASANDEWLELFNTTDEPVIITGWRLTAVDGSPDISIDQEVSVPAGGYVLLERTDDSTVPGVPAGYIYTGSLSNAGETLVLLDGEGTEIDRVDASEGWPAGDNVSKNTMQKRGEVWVTGVGTPLQENAGIIPAQTALETKDESTPRTSLQRTSPRMGSGAPAPAEAATSTPLRSLFEDRDNAALLAAAGAGGGTTYADVPLIVWIALTLCSVGFVSVSYLYLQLKRKKESEYLFIE